MTIETFRTTRFGTKAQSLIEQCNSIVDYYLADGLRLTLRQLYYQLVSKNIIPNTEKDYKNIGSIVSKARLSGLIDWAAIEDRVRQPKQVSEFKDLGELAEAAVASYRLPRWEGQKYYVELWVEKDALAGVLWPLAREFHVTLMVNRGYSSQSAMYESANRFINRSQKGLILYLGDHDPSGEDMVRDIRDRTEMFGVALEVEKIALTMEQIIQYKPPPNPAKITDPRANAYIKKYGNSSWEVDALPPNILAKIIRRSINNVLDRQLMSDVIEQEEEDKKRLREAVSELMLGY
jgi:hypothetical protein